jgi:2'-hydroxyisoflavone reductase
MGCNILIIGGSYFVGKVFVETLLEDSGNAVFVVNRGNRPIQMPGVTEILCDRHDERLGKMIPRRSWDAVVDFCAYTPLDVISLMSSISDLTVRQYILISTSSVYENTLDLPVTERSETLTAPQPELGPAAEYGYDKRRAEIKAREKCDAFKVPLTILRPAVIYGKYNYAPRESVFFDLIADGKTVALPENELALFQFVSVWDVAGSILKCIGNPLAHGRIFNLAGEELVSYRRLVEVIGEIVGRKASTYSRDAEKINAQGEVLPFPTDRHLIYSGSLIREVIGFDYTPFLEGMGRTWEWYRQAREETRHE